MELSKALKVLLRTFVPGYPVVLMTFPLGALAPTCPCQCVQTLGLVYFATLGVAALISIVIVAATLKHKYSSTFFKLSNFSFLYFLEANSSFSGI